MCLKIFDNVWDENIYNIEVINSILVSNQLIIEIKHFT